MCACVCACESAHVGSIMESLGVKRLMVQVKEDGIFKASFPQELPVIVGHHHYERKNGPGPSS